MWRALFLALGIVLVLAGIECLVVGRFMVQEARLPSAVKKALDKNGPVNPVSATVQSARPSSVAQGYGGVPRTQSGYEPLRFSNDQFFPQAVATGTESRAPFSLTGFGARGNSGPTNQTVRPVKIVDTRDWMPWSLVAAGVIIMLYTNRLAPGGGGSD
jgi:hypothetical protein